MKTVTKAYHNAVVANLNALLQARDAEIARLQASVTREIKLRAQLSALAETDIDDLNVIQQMALLEVSDSPDGHIYTAQGVASRQLQFLGAMELVVHEKLDRGTDQWCHQYKCTKKGILLARRIFSERDYHAIRKQAWAQIWNTQDNEKTSAPLPSLVVPGPDDAHDDGLEK